MIRFPYIDKWIADHGYSIRQAAKIFGISYSCLIHMLEGKGDPTMTTINKILKVTGMKYEKAFSETIMQKGETK